MSVKSDELRKLAEAKRRQVQVPGAGDPPPPAELSPPELNVPDGAAVGPESKDYWHDKPWREAEAWWLSLPLEKRRPLDAHCKDGRYVAPYVDPRILAGVRGV